MNNRLTTHSIFIYFFFLFSFSSCKKDTIISPRTELPTKNDFKKKSLATSNLSYVTSESYNIERALPTGYSKNGTVDYTASIQAALDKYQNIVFPAFPLLINEGGLTVPSNRVITFLEGSELRIEPNANDGYAILGLHNSSNVMLVNPVLKGDRYAHMGTTGEWGMGLSIYGGSNITVLNIASREMWGDGIYIGVEDGIITKNLTIKNAVCEYNRRDGITIIAIDGLLLESPYAAFSNGTKPMAGIAFEPNLKYQEIKNVVINNPKTQDNGTGMFVDFGNLMGGGQKNIGVTITNHTDLRSGVGMKAYSRVQDGSGSTIQGDLKITNPKWVGNSVKALQTILYGVADVHLIIENPIVVDIFNKQLSKDETLSYLKYKTRINTLAWSDISFSSSWPNLIAPVIIYAINAGGTLFTASDGITYAADKNFTGGSIYQSTNLISNTTDDKLYQCERYGNFAYSLPLSNGIYEVTLKLSEIYHSTSGRRQFDVLMEGSEVISNLDIFTMSGSNTAYDIVKSVEVTDGILNIGFKSDINNAKLSALLVQRKN